MIPIVFSSDHNFIMPTGVAICSMLMSAGKESYDIYILCAPDITEKDKEMLSLQVKSISEDSRISFLDMGEKFKEGYEVRGISTACYYRLMIPWLIPDIDKIIYCDGDVIINTPLTDLFAIDLEGMYVAGTVPSTAEGWIGMKKYFAKIGLDYRDYINSGVLVINSALQRKDSLEEEYNRLSIKNFHYQDQDIINIVCKGRISHFSCRFNLKPSELGLIEGLGQEVLIHYAGDKPWKQFSYAWDEWWRIYKRSLFYDGRYYHDVSSRILNPRHQMKVFKTKSTQKLRQYWVKFRSS